MTNTERIHRLLANSAPEPLSRADLARRLGLRPKAVTNAVRRLEAVDVVQRTRPMAGRGYGYTVNTEGQRPA
jgi:DNA-binding MarR family transcriptional regulator